MTFEVACCDSIMNKVRRIVIAFDAVRKTQTARVSPPHPPTPSILQLTLLSFSERLVTSKLPSRLQRLCNTATQIVLPLKTSL